MLLVVKLETSLNVVVVSRSESESYRISLFALFEALLMIMTLLSI